jgi:hypothetical protein
LCAFVVMSVFDQLLTAAAWTRMRYNRVDHGKVLQADLAVGLGEPFLLHQSICRHYRMEYTIWKILRRLVWREDNITNMCDASH